MTEYVIRRARQKMAGVLASCVYANDVEPEQVYDILLALQEQIDNEIKYWLEA